MKKYKINFRHGVADKGKAKDNFFKFWKWQYLKRNQEYRAAYQLALDPEADSNSASYAEAVRLAKSYGWMPPDREIHRKNSFWIIDEDHGRGHPAEGPLTADRILETLLEIREAQGCTTGNINCNYVLPRLSAFHVQEKLPNTKNLTELDLDEAFKRLKVAKEISAHSPPVKNQFIGAGESHRVKPWHLTRAIGIWLYDERKTLENDAEAIRLFIDEYSDDDRLPVSYRTKRLDKNLFELLRKTRECIEAREVLSFKK